MGKETKMKQEKEFDLTGTIDGFEVLQALKQGEDDEKVMLEEIDKLVGERLK